MRYVIIILLSIIFITACRKTKVKLKPNSITYFLNDEKLVDLHNNIVSSHNSEKTNFSFGFYRYHNKYKGVKELLVFQNIQLIKNIKQSIDGSKIFVRFDNTVIGGDNSCEKFLIDTTFDNNYIQLTHISNNKNVVKGEFNFRLKKVKDCPERDYAELQLFTKGYFYVCLKED